jgi:hypothetical protein
MPLTVASSVSSQQEFLADIVVLATGFELPKIDFLPSDLFPEDYEVAFIQTHSK